MMDEKDDPQVMEVLPMSSDERWEHRNRLSDAQLIDAASQALDIADELTAYGSLTSEVRASLILGRAQWYMLRYTHLRRHTCMMNLSTGRDLSPEARPDYADRRKGPNVEVSRCSDWSYHGEHVYEDVLLGQGKTYRCPGKYRPVRDNPQA